MICSSVETTMECMDDGVSGIFTSLGMPAPSLTQTALPQLPLTFSSNHAPME